MAWTPTPTQGGHGSLHAGCPNPAGVDRPHWRQTGPGRWFECTGCHDARHVRLCVYVPDGDLDCICGLDFERPPATRKEPCA